MKKDRKAPDEPSAPFWMTTYGDMVTLLFAFFVLLNSFAVMDATKFKEAALSLEGAFGVLNSHDTIKKQKHIEMDDDDVSRRKDIYKSAVSLKELAKKFGMEDQVDIEATETGMLIRVGDQVLFNKGDALLKVEALPILDLVAETIRGQAGEVLVCGHTDITPIHSYLYPSNWELSTARSLSAVKYLVDTGGIQPELFGAVGYGEFRPIAPNNSRANMQKNRRVEFLVTWK